MSEAFVTPQLLTWARERAGLQIETAAKRAGTTVERAGSWEEGEARPTFRQASLWAKATHVPFGFLFLPTPPEEALPIPDLRTAHESTSPQENSDFMDALRSVAFKMDWFRDYRVERGASPLQFVGSFGAGANPDAVAEDMRQVLRLSEADRRVARTFDDFLTTLVDRADAAGIWVIRSGVVGNDSSRPIGVNVFRGLQSATRSLLSFS